MYVLPFSSWRSCTIAVLHYARRMLLLYVYIYAAVNTTNDLLSVSDTAGGTELEARVSSLAVTVPQSIIGVRRHYIQLYLSKCSTEYNKIFKKTK